MKKDDSTFWHSRINYDVACNMDFHRFPVDEQYCEVKFESFGFTNKQVLAWESSPSVYNYLFQIQMKWMDQSHSNVNANISLDQFLFNVLLMDSYSTDYYDVKYPGLIMKVGWELDWISICKLYRTIVYFYCQPCIQIYLSMFLIFWQRFIKETANDNGTPFCLKMIVE